MGDITQIARVSADKIAYVGHMATLHGIPPTNEMMELSDQGVEEIHIKLHELSKDHKIT